MDIGKKIREMRQAKKISIRSMAEQTGVTPSMISQVERNLCSPSLLLLRNISEVLGIPVWFLLYDSDKPHTALTRKDERMLINIDKEGKLKQAYLVPAQGRRIEEEDHESQLEVIFDDWQPGAASGFISHKGEEAVFILSGKLEVSVGDDVIVLNEGDCVTYFADTPHQIKSIGDENAQFLTIITPATF